MGRRLGIMEMELDFQLLLWYDLLRDVKIVYDFSTMNLKAVNSAPNSLSDK